MQSTKSLCYSQISEENSLKLLREALQLLEGHQPLSVRDLKDCCECGNYKCQVLYEVLHRLNRYLEHREEGCEMINSLVSKFRDNKSTDNNSSDTSFNSETSAEIIRHDVSVCSIDQIRDNSILGNKSDVSDASDATVMLRNTTLPKVTPLNLPCANSTPLLLPLNYGYPKSNFPIATLPNSVGYSYSNYWPSSCPYYPSWKF